MSDPGDLQTGKHGLTVCGKLLRKHVVVFCLFGFAVAAAARCSKARQYNTKDTMLENPQRPSAVPGTIQTAFRFAFKQVTLFTAFEFPFLLLRKLGNQVQLIQEVAFTSSILL